MISANIVHIIIKLLIDVQTIKNSMIMLNNIHSYEFDTLRHIYIIHIYTHEYTCIV